MPIYCVSSCRNKTYNNSTIKTFFICFLNPLFYITLNFILQLVGFLCLLQLQQFLFQPLQHFLLVLHRLGDQQPRTAPRFALVGGVNDRDIAGGVIQMRFALVLAVRIHDAAVIKADKISLSIAGIVCAGALIPYRFHAKSPSNASASALARCFL